MSASQQNGNNDDTEVIAPPQEDEEKKLDNEQDKISTALMIERCQFFVIKNDQRKQLSSGKLQIITDEPDHTELVFTFIDYPEITHTLCLSKKRPTIKMCDSDYIFMNDSIDSFGLYIDTQYASIIQQFEQLIKPYCYFKVSTKIFPLHKYPINEELTVGPPDKIAIAGMKLAKLICKGSVATAKGIRRATLMGSNSINKSKRYLKTKLTPNEEATKISPKVQSGLVKAQMGGKAIVKVSGAVLTGAIATANALSNEVTDAVSKTELGQRITSESGPKTQAAKEIVKSTVAGVYTVYDELVSSGLHLVQQSSHATAEVLGHKYGDEVHRAAESTADIVDSAANTVVNVNMLGYKALAKRIAANSTVDVLSDETEKKDNQSKRVSINPMYAVQGLMIANNVHNELEENKKENRKRRQEYVGIESVDDSEDNYKIILNNDRNIMANEMVFNNENNGNVESNMNDEVNMNEINNQPGNGNNMNVNMNVEHNVNNDRISIFEHDDTLDVD
eukprot:865343_1